MPLTSPKPTTPSIPGAAVSAPLPAAYPGGGGAAVSALPAAAFPASPPFVYFHYPHRWEFVAETGEWLPELRKMVHDPGVNGVRNDGNADLAVAARSRRGAIHIDPRDTRLGEFGNYCVAHLNHKGGRHHVDKWVMIERIGRRGYTTPGTEGAGGYRKFQRHLVACGIIPPMRDAVRAELIQTKRDRLGQTLARLGQRPGDVALAERVKDMRSFIEAAETGRPVSEVRAEAEAVDKPAPRRRRTKKGADDAEAASA